MSKRIVQVTIVPKQVGEVFDDMLDYILMNLCQKPVKHGNKPLKQLIQNRYYPTYNLHQGQCYQQYTGNLCGYHATYNALCCLNMYLDIQSEYLMNSGACFWKFKKKVEKFLIEIKQYNKLGDSWPWREKDILTGDFERTYNNICMELFDDFDIFKKQSMLDDFRYMSFTWEFQYSNLLLSDHTRRDLNTKINKFHTYTGEKPLIFGVMLAITGHWTLFMAFKRNKQVQYWYFDSHNRDLLGLDTEEKIQAHIQDINNQRLKRGAQELTAFHKNNYSMRIKDTQTSLKLLIDCLEGRQSVDSYTYNQAFSIFAKPIKLASSHLEYEQNFQKSKSIEKQLDKEQETRKAIKDYWHNIANFFKIPIKWELLTSQNTQSMKQLIKLAESYSSRKLKANQAAFYEGRSLYDMIRKHNPRTKF